MIAVRALEARDVTVLPQLLQYVIVHKVTQAYNNHQTLLQIIVSLVLQYWVTGGGMECHNSGMGPASKRSQFTSR